MRELSGAVAVGAIVGVVVTGVGAFVGFPPIGFAAGVAAGSHIAARRTRTRGAVAGAAVGVVLLSAVAIAVSAAMRVTTNVVFVGETLVGAAALALGLGTLVGFLTRR